MKCIQTPIQVLDYLKSIQNWSVCYSRFQITFHCNVPNFVVKFGSSLRSSKVSFRSEFTSQFVNKGCDWLLNSMKPIKCLVYKPACEFWNELLNFATNFRTSQRSSESYNEKLPEIDCKHNLYTCKCSFSYFSSLFATK